MKTPYVIDDTSDVFQLSAGETILGMEFDEAPSGSYFWLYNVSKEKYVAKGLSFGGLASKLFTVEDLNNGVYWLAFSGTAQMARDLSGNIYTD